MDCLFCQTHTKVYEDDYVYAMKDSFPVSKGHTLIIPKRHIKTYFEASEDEVFSIHKALHTLKMQLDNAYQPDGYNIGINNGEASGQSIFHLHVHLIPRYKGDVKNPKGGVRGVIPGKQSY